MNQNSLLNDLQDLARALGLNDHHLSHWLQALAGPNGAALAAFCHQQAPDQWAADPSPDALAWTQGNPNGFGFGRALDALRFWGAAWPGTLPLTARAFCANLLLGQACSLFLGLAPNAGFAPALHKGGAWLLRYAFDGYHTDYTHDPDAAHDFHAALDWGLRGATLRRSGPPSLGDASSALGALLHDGQGAGWVAGASR